MPLITNIYPIYVIGGIGQKIVIAGTGFNDQQGGSYVSFKDVDVNNYGNYMDAATCMLFKYIKWTDNEVVVEIPRALTGKVHINIYGIDYESNDELHVKATLKNLTYDPLTALHLTNQNGIGGYTWYINEEFWNNKRARKAIEDVFEEFRYKTGANFVLNSAPTSNAINCTDKINIIAPDPALTVTGHCEDFTYHWTVNGVTFKLYEFFKIHITDKENWYYGRGRTPVGSSKFRYVLLHELGHAHGLHHVIENDQTMVGTVIPASMVPWSKRDIITPDEKIAIKFLVKMSQNFSFRDCGVSPMTTIRNPFDIYGKYQNHKRPVWLVYKYVAYKLKNLLSLVLQLKLPKLFLY